MKLKEKLATQWSNDKNDWHSCNGISLHVLREKAYLAGFQKALEKASEKVRESHPVNPRYCGLPFEEALELLAGDIENIGEEEADD